MGTEPGAQSDASRDAMGGDARHATLFATNNVGARHPSRVLSRAGGSGFERTCRSKPLFRRWASQCSRALEPNNVWRGTLGERARRTRFSVASRLSCWSCDDPSRNNEKTPGTPLASESFLCYCPLPSA